MRRLLSLAYLPAEQISEVFDRLCDDVERTETNGLADLLEYYQNTWLQSNIWPVTSWCAYQRYVRTNNDVEGWHNRLNAKLGRDNNPNLYLTINKLFEEATLSNIYTQLVANHHLTRDQAAKTRSKDGQLHQLWAKYEAKEITTYELLVRVSELVKLPF